MSDKKDIVLNNKKNKLVYAGIIAVLIVIIAVLVIPGKKDADRTENTNTEVQKKTSAVNSNSRYKLVKGHNGVVKFPVSSFDDTVQYFEYEGIRFFILKSNDGTIRAAFDACDVCYGAGRGYDQVQDYMQCNNCGQAFPEDKINVVLGGCNPSPLTREIIGKNLVIKTEDILKGQRFF